MDRKKIFVNLNNSQILMNRDKKLHSSRFRRVSRCLVVYTGTEDLYIIEIRIGIERLRIVLLTIYKQDELV